ncbi:MAG: RsiV family protein [Lachnospiraceae bacterium]|nr:RsiV family protein [bacterium]MDY5518046.1 RsiV family protein [Lachnospiraceae bacterium]
MKKMRRRSLSVLLVMAMLMSATSCGAVKKEENPQETEPVKQEADQVAEVEEQPEPEEPPESEEPETIMPEEKNAPLNVMKTSAGCQYSESVNDEWHSVETMQDFFLLEDESAKYYPKLAKALADYKNENESTIETTMGSLMENFTDVVVNGGLGVDLEDRTTRSVLRADQSYFSFMEQNESYYGGAHGGYMITGMTFDVNTGVRVTLSDLIKDAGKLKEIVAKQLDESYGDIFYEDVYQMIESYDVDGFTWSMDPFGITLYFNQYELAPYAAGAQMVDLAYDDYPELLDGAYFEPQEQYVLELYESEGIAVDVNNDGVKEQITVERSVDEYDYYTTNILLNDRTIKSEVEDYDAECYLVKCTDAAYLYVFHRMESDYSVLEVFDLTTGTPVNWGDGNSNLFMPGTYVSHEEDGRYYYETNCPVFVNPEVFYLSSRLDTLSTYNGTKKYHVGESGLPVSDDEVYTVDVGFLLKAKEDVLCKVMKADGTVIEENGVIPAGTFFKIVSATETEVWGVRAIDYVPESEEYDLNYFMVNAETTYDNDTLFYIQMDREYGDTIDGRDIWELLDGLMYAG